MTLDKVNNVESSSSGQGSDTGDVDTNSKADKFVGEVEKWVEGIGRVLETKK
jgi:hypothetical protein